MTEEDFLTRWSQRKRSSAAGAKPAAESAPIPAEALPDPAGSRAKRLSGVDCGPPGPPEGVAAPPAGFCASAIRFASSTAKAAYLGSSVVETIWV